MDPQAHFDLAEEIARLKHAIDTNDLGRVKSLMTNYPALHRAPMGYRDNGPLTWVAECRVPWEPPGPVRLAMAQWMIGDGSDVHQGGDGPLMRAALNGERIAMMELLVANGADVNAEWDGYFPILFSPCETVDPVALNWLLEHGANPNCARAGRKFPDDALDYVIQSYSRTPKLAACIDLLLKAGGRTRYNIPPVFDFLRGRVDLLAGHLDADPSLVARRFSDLDFGSTAMRGLTLRGGTLLHVAAEYCNAEAARLLLDRGADVDARGDAYGQTPLFHAASQFGNAGIEVVRLLADRGAHLSIRANVPGRFGAGEFVEGTALEYASRFPGGDERHAGRLNNRETIELLASRAR
ncbi:MAG: ankyrin repeat domain-containing protein [Acidobacteriia bacterium]|nr:ankyrin repeat domain-containing protein [Terriglobia bacterium]